MIFEIGLEIQIFLQLTVTLTMTLHRMQSGSCFAISNSSDIHTACVSCKMLLSVVLRGITVTIITLSAPGRSAARLLLLFKMGVLCGSSFTLEDGASSAENNIRSQSWQRCSVQRGRIN